MSVTYPVEKIIDEEGNVLALVDVSARALLGDDELQTNAKTCTGGINELKGTLDDVEGMLVSYILNYDLATNRFPLTDSMKAPLGNAQLTLVVRNAQTGALHVIWYNSSERKFVLASTLSGSAPSDGNSINVQYIATN